MIFLADDPVPEKKIASVCGFATAAETRKVLRGLQKKYIQEQSAFRAEEVAGGIQLFSAPE
ncbi:MAG: SMC-Scp complex subunit ScpB, partial [Planctomycetia bacterium]